MLATVLLPSCLPRMSSLPKRHEAIAPLARRWTRADITPQLDACHASIDWTEPTIYDAEPQAHCTVYNLGDGAAVHTSATDSHVKVRTCHPTIPGLEFRLVSRGDALVAEVWSDGARVARRALGESTGTKVLGAGVFGHPCFSRGGSQVVWTAERRELRRQCDQWNRLRRNHIDEQTALDHAESSHHHKRSKVDAFQSNTF